MSTGSPATLPVGLGLYITQEIVELHGGRVHIEQPEHRGSRFVVTLAPSAACRNDHAG